MPVSRDWVPNSLGTMLILGQRLAFMIYACVFFPFFSSPVLLISQKLGAYLSYYLYVLSKTNTQIVECSFVELLLFTSLNKLLNLD